MDGHHLGFADGYFDVARTDRVLEHVEDPQVVVDEMARVVCSGGTVQAAEPDWGTLTVDCPDEDLAERVIGACRDIVIRNGRVGRGVAALLRRAGLLNVEVSATTLLIRTYDATVDCLYLLRAADAANARGIVSPAENDAWKRYIRTSSEDGSFVASMCIFTATGKKIESL